ncbi:hypothetical protein NB640_12380 [Oxalobacter vibrioformis]|uniref:Uncharacterized protein n=1 Tax=Oxalobacter vibrioformis TaxID=933080 RepID=A0A9E9LYQ8_9BURK|nr:hypothetical protein [Oxalobacter vibrioformis]WAW09997.1 hypothetical protein NB640_12380 [Oxalobacter vibrioformis]
MSNAKVAGAPAEKPADTPEAAKAAEVQKPAEKPADTPASPYKRKGGAKDSNGLIRVDF